MDTIILNAHRGFAYLALVAIAAFVIALLMTMFGYSGRITNLLKKSTLVTMIVFHLQFLVGLAMLFFKSPFLDIVNDQGMGAIMKNEALRISYIEHPFAMLIAAVLFTIVNKKLKTNVKINFGIVILGVIAIALFIYAFLPMSDRLFS